uniref:Retrotransposon Copia-like N-terminal domain-containing protein n=2 Tax=Cajanus cajan TaxID=3821 RepID=A0A151RQ28_CAJCA|nr:hypothetical protein KK1_033817 [Cajanus cajan]
MSGVSEQTPSIDSFLYLHPSENPTIALVSPVLDSNNYHSWSRSMITALSAKNKVEFVDGSSPEPPKTDQMHGAWRRCNNMVVSWIVHSVSISIWQSVLWMDNAEEIWRDLKSRYSQGDLLRISDLQQEASSMKQGDLSVTEFFTKLRIIWDEIENFRLDPVCSCTVKCSCSVFVTIAQHKLEDRAMQFLRGLNEQYSNVRSHVLLMDPMPAISKIFSYVAQQERQLLGNSFMTNINVESKEKCCYRKHGFPPNYDGKNKGNNTKNGKTCTHCGRNGHTIHMCYKKHGFPLGHKFFNTKNTTNSIVTVDSKVIDDQTQHHESQEVHLTPQQYKALLALIQQSSLGNSASIPSHVNQIASVSSCSTHHTPPSSISLSSINCTPTPTSWILDSGATDHVSSSLTHFHSYNQIDPISIKLPNSHHVHATHSGIIYLSASIILSNVLYIPSFTFNLISISKLASTTNCKLIFSSTSCIL